MKAPLTPEQVTKIQEAMNKRYNVQMKALDLSKFSLDSAFGGSSFQAYLFDDRIMQCVVDTIKEHLSDLEAVNLDQNGLYSMAVFSKVIEKARNIKVLYLEKNKVKFCAHKIPTKLPLLTSISCQPVSAEVHTGLGRITTAQVARSKVGWKSLLDENKVRSRLFQVRFAFLVSPRVEIANEFRNQGLDSNRRNIRLILATWKSITSLTKQTEKSSK